MQIHSTHFNYIQKLTYIHTKAILQNFQGGIFVEFVELQRFFLIADHWNVG